MEQQRLFLTIGLFFLLYLAYDAWQLEFGPKPAPVPYTQTADETTASQSADASGVPMGADNTSSSAVPQSLAPSSIPGAATTPAARAIKQAQRIIVETDVFRLEIDSRGGDIRIADLVKYPTTSKKSSKAFRLMNDANKDLFIAQSGFAGKHKANDGTVITAPNHNTIYKVEQTSYKLVDGKDVIKVNLFWNSPDNVLFTKSYELKRGSYQINVSHKIENNSGKTWRGNLYQQLQRKDYEDENKSSFIYTYTGGVLYSPEEKYQKIKFSDMEDEDLKQEIKNGWAAIIQHYFLAAWVPPVDSTQSYFTRDLKDLRYVMGMKATKETQVATGSSEVLNNILYVGPKIQQDLEKIAPGLELTVDYGVLTFIAKPIFWLMTHIHNLVGNWGWTIILLTMLIKLSFYKLSEKSYKSMANMRKVQPRLAALKERFGDDRQKMNQAMMKMYKEEKINPLGGCLPILVQIPVFISLYWVLLESVELRQADWIFWFTDLSAKDPYFVLPLLMGITMFIQQKLNPPPMDPMQAKIMSALPVVFTVFFAFFPSGLVLYWVVNNTLSIAQQWYITRIVIKA
ncbi:MAG: membrane protein insertase YidC [Gammaproteobacteria bacterium]|nr:MAG: membrane protein insertase YidC [Gammaproteobacteria bacterium]